MECGEMGDFKLIKLALSNTAIINRNPFASFAALREKMED
jgi:hypothetical protein